MSAGEPHIVGSWVTDDQSANHPELALTDQTAQGRDGKEPVFALRDSYRPSQQIFMPRSHLLNLAQAAQRTDTEVGRLISSASAR